MQLYTYSWTHLQSITHHYSKKNPTTIQTMRIWCSLVPLHPLLLIHRGAINPPPELTHISTEAIQANCYSPSSRPWLSIRPARTKLCINYMYLHVFKCIYMYLYVSICIYMYVFICIYMYVHVCIFIYIYLYVLICFYMYLYVFVYIYMYLYIFTSIHMYLYVFICLYMYLNIQYLYVFEYIYMYLLYLYVYIQYIYIHALFIQYNIMPCKTTYVQEWN